MALDSRCVPLPCVAALPSRCHTLPPPCSVDLGRLVTVVLFLDDVPSAGQLIFPAARWPTDADALDAAQHALGRGGGPRPHTSADGGLPVQGVGSNMPSLCASPGAVRVPAVRGDAVVVHNHLPDLRLDRRAVWGLCPSHAATARVLLLRYSWAEFDTSAQVGGTVTRGNEVAALLDQCKLQSSWAETAGLQRGGLAPTIPQWRADAFHGSSSG